MNPSLRAALRELPDILRPMFERRKQQATRALLEKELPAAKRLYQRMRDALGLVRHKDDTELPRGLRWLIRELKRQLADLFEELQAGRLRPNEWRDAVKRALAEHHLAAIMAGLNTEAIPAKAWQGLVDEVNVQVEFLNNFKVEIQRADEFEAGWQARAASYAESIKTPYWRGRTKILPLPAMPGQGSQCLDGCNCQWDVKPVNAENGDYDCYWRLEAGSEHCQTCLERSQQWAPLRIREGVVL